MTMKSIISFSGAWLAALPLLSQAMGPESVLPAAMPFHVGQIAVTSLSDTQYVLPNDGKIFGVGESIDAVATVLIAANSPANVITLPVDALLVKDGARVVLVDTGLGPKQSGALIASLKLAGVAPKDVTDVLITHPHPDHIGGLLTADGQSAFPKARIRFSVPDWQDLAQNAGQAALVRVIKPQVETFTPGASVTPSITSVSLPGHSPGHVGYRVSSAGASLLDVGDVVHSSVVSLAHPEWVMGFDQDRQAGSTTRQHLLAELAQSREMIFAPHFPYPGVGTVAAAGAGYKWTPASLPGDR
jgi:glyoxylase-like metal-dependent hydrolase (beta-lactamase superfamily II)